MFKLEEEYNLDRIYEYNPPIINRKWLIAARVLWILFLVIAVVFLFSAVPGYLDKINNQVLQHSISEAGSVSARVIPILSSIASLFSSILSITLSIILFRRKFDNLAVMAVSFYLIFYGIIMTGPLEIWENYWLGRSNFSINAQTFLMATPTIALLALFPNGKFIPRWTRWLLILSVFWVLLTFFFPLFPYSTENILSLIFISLFWIILLIGGLYAQSFRYRKISTITERQQTKWVLFGFGLWIGYILVSSIPYFYLSSLPLESSAPWWAGISELGWWFSVNIVPVTLSIAILRSRLWNIDFVINRTLIYVILIMATMALYVFMIGFFGNLFRIGDQGFLAFITTGIVALVFHPLHVRLQSVVNRLMYGERDDPVAVLSKLGETLERTGSPEDALQRIVETIARALKIPYAAIQFDQEEKPAAVFGLPKEGLIHFPLLYHNQTSGYLVVAPRSAGENFSPIDIRLLENIAHQAGAAVHAAKLTTDLRISQRRLITAREVERRRIRRDLHDGLGPTLASLTLSLDTARNIIPSQPQEAIQLLEELKKQTQDTIKDIRTLVYELRPPALDDYGLIGAIRNFIDQHTNQHPIICLEADNTLVLPVALEAAAYRIILEGINNAIKHANANHITVKINHINEFIHIDIKDDGQGLPQNITLGVGLTSMKERAEELGGVFSIFSDATGVHLWVEFPLMKEIG